MRCNLGKTDRILRVISGIVLIGLGFYLAGNIGIFIGVIGAIPLLTGLVGFCPAYTLFKVNTCNTKNV